VQIIAISVLLNWLDAWKISLKHIRRMWFLQSRSIEGVFNVLIYF